MIRLPNGQSRRLLYEKSPATLSRDAVDSDGFLMAYRPRSNNAIGKSVDGFTPFAPVTKLTTGHIFLAPLFAICWGLSHRPLIMIELEGYVR
jgi:hypothetical protein